jgi:uncharacterized membrane protein
MKRLRVLGHPVHPPTVHLPLGLWAAAGVFDAAALVTGRPALWTMSAGCLGLGCAAALPALATGLLDLVALEIKEAETAALWHMGLMASCFGLYLFSLLARRGLGAPEHMAAAVTLQYLGLACLSVGGWLGGHLVYSHGVGVGEKYNGGDGTRTPG